MKRMATILGGVAVLSLGAAASVDAATLNALGNFEVTATAVSGDRQRSLVGDAGGSIVVVQSFAVPNLLFTSASYTAPAATAFFGGGSDGGNVVDLYALPGSTGAGALPTTGQFYVGTADATADGRVRLDAAFLTGNNFGSGTTVVNRTTDADASAALLAFLNANAGTTVFIRLNAQAAGGGGFDGYDVYSNTGTSEGGASGTTGASFITYEGTPVPEPSTAAVAGLLAAGGLGARRRSRR